MVSKGALPISEPRPPNHIEVINNPRPPNNHRPNTPSYQNSTSQQLLPTTNQPPAQPTPLQVRLLQEAQDILSSEALLLVCAILFPVTYTLLPQLLALSLGKEVNVCRGVVDTILTGIPLVLRACTRSLHIAYVWVCLLGIFICLWGPRWIHGPEACISMGLFIVTTLLV